MSAIQTSYATRIDMMKLYERLERYTSLQSRVLSQSNAEQAEYILITPGDYKIVNPLIELALADVADYLGALVTFEHSGLDALTEWGLKDNLLRRTETAEEDTEETPEYYLKAVYKLPGTSQHDYVTGLHEMVFEAIAMHVIGSWFKHLGYGNKAQLYVQEYYMRLNKARNAAPAWKNAPKRRPSVNL